MKPDIDRKDVLRRAVGQMKSGKLSVRAAVAWCRQEGVEIQKSALCSRKLGLTLRDGPGAQGKLPPNLIKDLVTYIEAVRVAFRMPVFIMCMSAL